jgi:hypothetical protein
MDSVSAFIMGSANRGKPLMVFDWDRAARRIRETNAAEASAGLSSDWEYTGGPIYRNGAPVPADDTYTYLASTWATPEVDLDGELEDCWRYAHDTPGWGASTYWPESAAAVLQTDNATTE